MPAPQFLMGLLLLLSIFVTLARVYTTPSLSDPAVKCGFSEQEVAAPDPDALNLQLWSVAPPIACWRVYGPALAARTISQPKLNVGVTTFETLSSVYRRQLVEAIQRGAAPDLAVIGSGELADWGQRGYLAPFDDCRTHHRTFDAIDERLWAAAMWNHQLWGVPVESRIELLYFNKRALRQLGWSEQQVTELPLRIAQGTFTLDDLLATAEQAVAAKVVEPGYGFWPSQEKFDFFQLAYLGYADSVYDVAENKLALNRAALTQTFALQRRLITQGLTVDAFASPKKENWLDTNLWRDAVIQGHVLFWTGSNNEWGEWENEYVSQLGGLAYLERTIGYALFPSVTRGVPGHVLWLHTAYYAILSSQATGRNHQAAACTLLAHTVTATINAKHITQATYLGVLTSPAAHAAYAVKPFNAATMAMWPYAKANYHRYTALFTWFQDGPTYDAILLDALATAAQGQVEPATAAATALERLQTLLGDRLMVE